MCDKREACSTVRRCKHFTINSLIFTAKMVGIFACGLFYHTKFFLHVLVHYFFFPAKLRLSSKLVEQFFRICNIQQRSGRSLCNPFPWLVTYLLDPPCHLGSGRNEPIMASHCTFQESSRGSPWYPGVSEFSHCYIQKILLYVLVKAVSFTVQDCRPILMSNCLILWSCHATTKSIFSKL